MAMQVGPAILWEAVSQFTKQGAKRAADAAWDYSESKRVKEIADKIKNIDFDRIEDMARTVRKTWNKNKKSRRIRTRKRRMIKRRFRSKKASATTTSRYRPYAVNTIRSKRSKIHKLSDVIERADCLSKPASRTLIQQNTEITSAANQCGWDEFFACTSYGCDGFLGKDLPRQYGCHLNSGTAAEVNTSTKLMYMKSIHLNFCVRDNISGTSHLKLYTVKCIRSHKASDYAGNWPGMLTTGLGSYYHSTFSQCSNPIASTMVSFSPFTLPGFGRYWKVIREEDFYIESAQSVDINKVVTINRFFQGKDIANFDFFKNCSYMYLFKIVGDTDTSTPWNLTAGGVSICVNKVVYSKFVKETDTGDRVYDGYDPALPV